MHQSFQNLIDTAQQRQRESDAANAALNAALLRAMQALLPPGIVIDLRDARNTPSYACIVRTTAGNGRGTHVFRIERVTGVEINPNYPDRACWMAKATPISEKTGKDMAGSVAYTVSTRGPLVDLIGEIIPASRFDETPESSMKSLVKLVESTFDSSERPAPVAKC